MSKFSISISDADRAELDAQAQALGKTKTAHATDVLLAGLSGGDSTIQALDLSRAQLRATELKLRKTTRLLRDGKVAEVLGTATGPPWSSALLVPKDLRIWWTELGEFVAGVGAYGVEVEMPGWWTDRHLVEALAAAKAWWDELETPGGDAAAAASDKVEWLRWVSGRENVKTIAAACAKAIKARKGLEAEADTSKAAKDKAAKDKQAFEDFVYIQVAKRTKAALPVAAAAVEVGPDGMTDLARMVEPAADLIAREAREHDASTTPKRDRPGVDRAAIEAANRAAIEAEAEGLDPEEREYRQRRARDLAEEPKPGP